MLPKEKALKLCQNIGMTSFGSDFNEGSTLPLDITKKIAVICVEEILNDKHGCGCEQSIVMDGNYQTYHTYWSEVKNEIQSL